MNIDSTAIINTAKAVVKNGIKGTNEIGSAVRGYAKDFKVSADTFINNHESVKNIAQKAKNNKVGKDTFVGFAVIIAALYLAGKCLIGLKNKISSLIHKK